MDSGILRIGIRTVGVWDGVGLGWVGVFCFGFVFLFPSHALKRFLMDPCSDKYMSKVLCRALPRRWSGAGVGVGTLRGVVASGNLKD